VAAFFSVLCCVEVEALQWTDVASNEPTEMSEGLMEVNFEFNQATGPDL
jgi:hypothetical protein